MNRAAYEADLRRRMLELLADCQQCSQQDHEAFADAFVRASRPYYEQDQPAAQMDLFGAA